MLRVLAPELWLSRFATRLRRLQPIVDQSLAMDTANLLHPMLGWERPEDAVMIFLQVMREQNDRLGADVAALLQRIQSAADGKGANQSDKGSGSA